MSVTIIEKPGINGMKNLALEYSPAILSKRTGKAVFIEDLVHRVYADPSYAGREADKALAVLFEDFVAYPGLCLIKTFCRSDRCNFAQEQLR